MIRNNILFTTNDGIEIKNRDTYYYYVDSKMKLYSIIVCSWQDHSPAKGFIQFGTEKAAIDYRTKNINNAVIV